MGTADGRAEQTDVVGEVMSQWRKERPDLDPSPMAIFGRVARIFSLQRAAQAEVHRRYGLNHASFDVLANLRRSGPPHRKTASSLAESSMISTGGITFRLDGLEQAGLLKRVRDDRDRRVVFAELTPAGLELIDHAIADHIDGLAALLDSLSADEREELAGLLNHLESSIRTAMG
jgi:DNA-binding MarR family transcriptional regulator